MEHLFFTCSTAKTCLGANNIAASFEQAWNWCEFWFKNGKQFHATGIVAICWAVWKMKESSGNCMICSCSYKILGRSADGEVLKGLKTC